MVGRAATILLARALTRRGGTTVLVGAAPRSEEVTFSAWELHLEGALLGCSNGSAHVRRDVPRFIRLAEAGLLDLGSLITSRIGLEDVDHAFDAMRRGEGMDGADDARRHQLVPQRELVLRHVRLEA